MESSGEMLYFFLIKPEVNKKNTELPVQKIVILQLGLSVSIPVTSREQTDQSNNNNLPDFSLNRVTDFLSAGLHRGPPRTETGR